MSKVRFQKLVRINSNMELVEKSFLKSIARSINYIMTWIGIENTLEANS